MKKALISILLILVIITVGIGVKKVIDYINDNIEPVIYYSFNDNPNLPLSEDNKVFANNLKIVWTNKCSGTIKKEGKVISKNSGALISSDGIYEINVKSPSGKNKITKIVKLDKTPPEVKITKNASGTYRITFADITDVNEAYINKFNADTRELISKTDLIENGLKPSIEITEKGYYIFVAIDKMGNATEEIELTIE